MSRFQIATQTHDDTDPSNMKPRQWQVAVVSQDAHLDERSLAATNFVKSRASNSFSINFRSDSNKIFVNSDEATLGKLRAQLFEVKSVVIEATSLSFPELLYTLEAATKAKVKTISLLDLEPQEYRRSFEERLSDHRDFVLSNNCRFRSMPHFMVNLQELPIGRVIFFLGYEGSRLGQALQQEELLQNWKKHIAFGVPAFESGWEIDAISNNIEHFSHEDQIEYLSASSVSASYRLLNRLRMEDKEDMPHIVAPLGTKPHAIGAALFLIEHGTMNQSVLIYDHPERAIERTKAISRWHLYDVTDTSSR
jgi:hypothetical protein